MLRQVNFQGEMVEVDLSDWEYNTYNDYNTKPASMLTKDSFNEAFKVSQKILKVYKEKGAYRKFFEVINDLKTSGINMKDIKSEFKKIEDKDKEEYEKQHLILVYVGKPYNAKAGRGNGFREIVPEFRLYKSSRKERGSEFYPYVNPTASILTGKGMDDFKKHMAELKTNEKQNEYLIETCMTSVGVAWAKQQPKYINKFMQEIIGIKNFKFIPEKINIE